VPWTRLSWQSRQLLSIRKSTASYRIVSCRSRWLYHRVCGAWPVRRQNRGCLPGRRALPLLPHVFSRRSEHIMPVLRQLHWLPVRQRIEFKMTVLVYKALNGLSPQYLVDDCQLITTTGRRRLPSSNVATCDVPRTRTTLGDRSFTAAGPHLWNSLPLHLCDFELSLFEFRRLLKTH